MTREDLIAAFWARRMRFWGHQIDNATLYAGSPMYFYCRHCGVETERLPETYTCIPLTLCGSCTFLERQGIDPAILLQEARERAPQAPSPPPPAPTPAEELGDAWEALRRPA